MTMLNLALAAILAAATFAVTNSNGPNDDPLPPYPPRETSPPSIYTYAKKPDEIETAPLVPDSFRADGRAPDKKARRLDRAGRRRPHNDKFSQRNRSGENLKQRRVEKKEKRKERKAVRKEKRHARRSSKSADREKALNGPTTKQRST